uniref:Uncharacterized protein n=1 Tax=Pyxicephalus adspersus TaxID=30357 RepID=A0AAV2ZQR7_PYXAD|nr:TPA: hypothetical protein GDO54_003857 [Pyxicephalus adspersus]
MDSSKSNGGFVASRLIFSGHFTFYHLKKINFKQTRNPPTHPSHPLGPIVMFTIILRKSCYDFIVVPVLKALQCFCILLTGEQEKFVKAQNRHANKTMVGKWINSLGLFSPRGPVAATAAYLYIG